MFKYTIYTGIVILNNQNQEKYKVKKPFVYIRESKNSK